MFAEDLETVVRGKQFQAALFDAGLAGITWPAEYGGQGLPARYQTIFNEEATPYELPTGIYMIGHGMLGPTLMAHATEELKKRYIPPMLRGEEIWCQLFSEPGAGSDVASLRRVPCATATSGSSTARRCGHQVLITATTASSSPAPIPTSPSIAASRCSLSTCANRASP